MKKILVAYTTNSGSTSDIAEAVVEELKQSGAEVDLRKIEDSPDPSAYDAVVIGGPMIMGWHRNAVAFIKKHRAVLAAKPVAYFLAAMSLTDQPDPFDGRYPLTLDPNLVVEPKNPRRLSFKENFATVANYLKPVLKAAPEVKPVSIAFFGGKLEMFRLNFLAMLFVMVVIQAAPRDLRNWDLIHDWGRNLAGRLAQA